MNEKVCKRLISICFVLYAGFMLYVCLHIHALVPDEKWFLNIVNKDIKLESFADVLRVPNYLGYGSIYWIIMRLLRKFVFMRLLSFAFLVSVFVCIVKTNRKLGLDEEGIFFSCLLYLSSPLSWFTGKIIGPEIMGWSVGVWGGYCSITALNRTGEIKYRWLLLGSIILGALLQKLVTDIEKTT